MAEARKRQTPTYLFILRGGVEPDETTGPFYKLREIEAAVLDQVRTNPELLSAEGEDALYSVTVQEGRPIIGTFSAGFMDRCRARVERERRRLDQRTR